MALANKKAAILLKLAIMLSLFAALTMVNGRLVSFDIGSPPSLAKLSCDSVYGVQTGDTCLAVAEDFKFTALQFSGFNPNLDCDKLFVGQWLCINGRMS